jgi:hypothetical protein
METPSPITTIPIGFKMPPRPPPFRPKIPLFPIILPGLGFRETRKKRAKGKRPYYYQPSLAAMGLDITATKVPKGVWTGLVLRPKIKKKRKKK